MAWAEKLPAGGFRGCYRDHAGRKRSSKTGDDGRPFVRKKQAEAWATAQEDRARRTGRDLTAGRMLWGEWCDRWHPTRRLEPSTLRSGAPTLKRVRARWDGVRLDEIRPMALRAWVRELETHLSASSVRNHFSLLSSSLRDAQAEGLIELNPCRGVELPPLPPAEERFLTDAEVSQVLYRLDGPYRVLGELLIGTGMRLSEACGLHWHRVDLARGVVDVIETWDRDTDDPTADAAGAMKAYPKGKKRRTVPMTPELTELLVHWHDRRAPADSCGRPHAKHSAARERARARGVDPVDRCRSGLVVPGPKGAPIHGGNFGKRQWKRACEDAGVDATVHALRHTYASRLVTAGVSIARVRQLLGHVSIVTTERYAHLQDDGHDEVRAALAGRGAARGADEWTAAAAGGNPWTRPRAV
jgi:integrase